MRLGAPPAALLPDLFRLMGRLGLLGRVLVVSWGRHGGLLGSSWATLGCLGVPLGVSSGGHGACLGFCKDPGASPWVLWGAFNGHGGLLGSSWRPQGSSWSLWAYLWEYLLVWGAWRHGIHWICKVSV